MDWRVLRLFLAVAREGSIRRAATKLGVNHTTISRQLRSFESDLGASLLERQGTRLVLTQEGEDVLRTATQVEKQILGLSRRIEGRDERLEGRIRITMPDFLNNLMVPILAEFTRRHPAIELILMVGEQPLNLAQRDADIALRITPNPPETLFGRRLARPAAAVYGHRQYLADQTGKSLEEMDWISWDERLGQGIPLTWMRTYFPEVTIRWRVDSPESMLQALYAGIGIGFMAVMNGDADPELQRLTEIDAEIGGELWLLAHRDLCQSARYRTLMDFIADQIKQRRTFLEQGTTTDYSLLPFARIRR